jgi:hypothetical protein
MGVQYLWNGRDESGLVNVKGRGETPNQNKRMVGTPTL